MWRFSLFIALIMSFGQLTAQEKTYEINGEELLLKKEAEGELTLLWNVIDNEYRYFIKKDGDYFELLNTRQNGDFQEEYKEALATLTSDANVKTEDVKLVLYSLRDFVNEYNLAVDSGYTFVDKRGKITKRLGVFGGASNNIYTENPDNLFAPILGIELELIDPNLALRHSIFFQLRHSVATTDFEYTSTSLSLNYRFKLINSPAFKFFVDAELVNFFHSEDIEYVLNDAYELEEQVESGFGLTSPFSFGVGADFRILPGGYITVGYNDIVSLVLESNGNFPADFTVGYKMTL